MVKKCQLSEAEELLGSYMDDTESFEDVIELDSDAEIVLDKKYVYVEAFNVCYEENGSMKKCYEGTTIGYKRIVDLKGIHTDSLAIVIEDSRVAPAMAFVGVY